MDTLTFCPLQRGVPIWEIDSYLFITSNYTLPTVALNILVAITTLPELLEFDIT